MCCKGFGAASTIIFVFTNLRGGRSNLNYIHQSCFDIIFIVAEGRQGHSLQLVTLEKEWFSLANAKWVSIFLSPPLYSTPPFLQREEKEQKKDNSWRREHLEKPPNFDCESDIFIIIIITMIYYKRWALKKGKEFSCIWVFGPGDMLSWFDVSRWGFLPLLYPNFFFFFLFVLFWVWLGSSCNSWDLVETEGAHVKNFEMN